MAYVSDFASRPLASLCIRVSNGGKNWIAETIGAAFAQDYSPMEIVIYDDCSTDGSAAEVQSIIDLYRQRNGKHHVVFVQGEISLGNAKAAEKVFSIANGELLIQNDQDDISLPNRVSRIMEAWLEAGKQPKIIHCSGWCFKRVGGKRTLMQQHDALHPLGAACAYSSDVFRAFPPISVQDTYEDGPWAFRALLLGPELILKDRLVLYRVESGASSSMSVIARTKTINRSINGWRQSLMDLDKYPHLIPSDKSNKYKKFIHGAIASWARERDFISGTSFSIRWRNRPDYMQRWRDGKRMFTSIFTGHPGLSLVVIKDMAHLLPLSIGIPIADCISRFLSWHTYR